MWTPAVNLATTAGATTIHTSLVAALTSANLVATLSGTDDYTVFAPTDAAFAALPDGTVATLLMPENKDQLVAILTYHVVPAKVMSGDIAGKKANVLTVNGKKLFVNAKNGVEVDNATVIAADIEASNGVIHVIDTVLLPN